MKAWMRPLVVATLLSLAALACNGEEKTATPTPSPTVTATPTAAETGTAEATETPAETATEEATETAEETETVEETETPEEVETPEDGETVLDPGRADDLVHAALLTAGELPGGGWEVTAEDEFDDAPVSGLNEASPACREIIERGEELEKLTEEDREARAQRGFSRKPPGDDPFAFPTEVEHEVAVFSDTGAVREGLDQLGRLLEGDELQACFEESIRKGFEGQGLEGVELEIRQVEPSVEPREGGHALALELDINFLGLIDGTLRFENYIWLLGNAGIEVSVNGSVEELTPEFIEEVLSLAQGAAEDAENRAENPPATPEATEEEATPEEETATPEAETTPAGTPADAAAAIMPGILEGGLCTGGEGYLNPECPATDRLKEFLAAWDIPADPICRCQDLPQPPSVGAVEQVSDTEAHVQIEGGAGLTMVVVLEDGTWKVDDTYCTAFPPGSSVDTSIYGDQALPCFQ